MNCVADTLSYTVTVLEFASRKVNKRGEGKIDPLNMFMNMIRGSDIVRMEVEPADFPGKYSPETVQYKMVIVRDSAWHEIKKKTI